MTNTYHYWLSSGSFINWVRYRASTGTDDPIAINLFDIRLTPLIIGVSRGRKPSKTYKLDPALFVIT